MQSTMMDVPLSLNHLLERAGRLFGTAQVVTRLPDKSLRTHSYAEIYRRARALGSALQRLGLQRGDRVATLCWNHHVHLECYFGIPAAGGVAHTLNLRLPPREIGWIAADAHDCGERQGLLAMRWVPLAELLSPHEPIYPTGLGHVYGGSSCTAIRAQCAGWQLKHV